MFDFLPLFLVCYLLAGRLPSCLRSFTLMVASGVTVPPLFANYPLFPTPSHRPSLRWDFSSLLPDRSLACGYRRHIIRYDRDRL